MSTDTEEASLHFLDYWRVVKVHKFVVLTVFLLVTGSAAIYTINAPRSYVSMARINVESDRPAVSVYGRDGGSMDMTSFATQFEIIQSKEVLYPVVDQLKLQERWAQRAKMDRLQRDITYYMLKGTLQLNVTRGTTIIEIRCWSEDKGESAEIANAVAQAYETYRLDEKFNETTRGLDKINDEYKKQMIEVEGARERVEKLRKELNITDTGGIVQGGGREEQEQLRRKEGELLDAEITMKTQRLRLQNLSKLSLSELKNAINFLQPEGNIPGLISQVMEAERRLEELKSTPTGPNHPDFRQAKVSYETLRTQLDGQLDGVLRALRIAADEQDQRVKILNEDLEKLRQREMLSHSAKYTPFTDALRSLETQQMVLDNIYARLKQERLEIGLPRRPVRVIDPAEPSYVPARPNVPLNITLGAVVGLVVGVCLAFFVEYLDTSIHKVDDVEKYLHIPVLGIVPRKVKPLNQVADVSPYAEFYRVLRANIEFSRKDTHANSITFCSGGAGEGKSTTLINTAYIYAEHGQRVLVVDSDVRRPTLHKILGIEKGKGLTDVILRGATLDEVIRPTSMNNISFIGSGDYHADAMGILAMGRMRELIGELKKRYDMVFFDSPPVIGISDASILAREVDLAVLIIQFRRFPRQLAIRAQAALDKAGVRLLGVVLNQVKSDEDDYYYYNYDYAYAPPKEAGTTKKGAEKAKAAPKSDLTETF